MYTSIFIICVFATSNSKYIEPHKIICKTGYNVTNQHLICSEIEIDTKVIDNETILTDNQKKKQLKYKESVRVQKNYNVLTSNLKNKDESAEQSKEKPSNKKQHRNKPNNINSRNEAKFKNRSRNGPCPKSTKQMATLAVDECSSGKERADDGNCVSIEITLESDEIIDFEISTREIEPEVYINSTESNRCF